MNYLNIQRVMEIHRAGLEHSGGSDGIRDLGALESAVAQPSMAFGGDDLYPTLIEKAAALGFSLIMNHPFIDGNKRVGFLGMVNMLMLNGMTIKVDSTEGERMIIAVAAGEATREELVEWLRKFTVTLSREADEKP